MVTTCSLCISLKVTCAYNLNHFKKWTSIQGVSYSWANCNKYVNANFRSLMAEALSIVRSIDFLLCCKRGLNLILLYYDSPFVRHCELTSGGIFALLDFRLSFPGTCPPPMSRSQQNMTPISVCEIIQTRVTFFFFFLFFLPPQFTGMKNESVSTIPSQMLFNLKCHFPTTVKHHMG